MRAVARRRRRRNVGARTSPRSRRSCPTSRTSRRCTRREMTPTTTSGTTTAIAWARPGAEGRVRSPGGDNAAVQRVKLPLISGNGAVPQHHGRPRAVPGGGEYAPAAPLRADAPPRRRRTKRQSWADENREISSRGFAPSGRRRRAVLARAGLVPREEIVTDTERRAGCITGGWVRRGCTGWPRGWREGGSEHARGALQRGAVQLRGKLRPKQASQTTRADGEKLLFLSEGRRVGGKETREMTSLRSCYPYYPYSAGDGRSSKSLGDFPPSAVGRRLRVMRS